MVASNHDCVDDDDDVDIDDVCVFFFLLLLLAAHSDSISLLEIMFSVVLPLPRVIL